LPETLLLPFTGHDPATPRLRRKPKVGRSKRSRPVEGRRKRKGPWDRGTSGRSLSVLDFPPGPFVCSAPPRGGTYRPLPPRVPSPLRGSVTRGYGSKAPSGPPSRSEGGLFLSLRGLPSRSEGGLFLSLRGLPSRSEGGDSPLRGSRPRSEGGLFLSLRGLPSRSEGGLFLSLRGPRPDPKVVILPFGAPVPIRRWRVSPPSGLPSPIRRMA
jgi:hypothetical protein